MKRNLRYKTILLLVLTIFLLPLYAAGQQKTSARAKQKRQIAAVERWKKTELYFGTNKTDKTQVSEAEFQLFVDEEITARFPDGLTILTGYGQFRGADKTMVKEKSFVLILLYTTRMKNVNRFIQEIRENYKRTFKQESVLRVDSYVLVSF